MGSLALGNIIDKYHCLKKLLILQPLLVAILLLLTQNLLELNFPDLPVLFLISVAGAPLSSISVSSYMLAAQVTYPVNEALSVGVMNTVNKIVTFLLIMASNILPKVEWMLPMWAVIALLGVIPACMYRGSGHSKDR